MIAIEIEAKNCYYFFLFLFFFAFFLFSFLSFLFTKMITKIEHQSLDELGSAHGQLLLLLGLRLGGLVGLAQKRNKLDLVSSGGGGVWPPTSCWLWW